VNYLALATVYSFVIPLKGTLALYDTVILFAMFVGYSMAAARTHHEEPELEGPAEAIARLGPTGRRVVVVAIFAFATAAIFTAAEPFAESLVATGKGMGIDEFLLVQWVAPLASEAPELLVAGLYAWRLKTTDALATLVSSKVNQWSLLVGTLPVVFAMAAGSLHGLPIDTVQREELLITAAQSLFAVALLVTLSITVWGALSLLVLFVAQFLLAAVLPPPLQEAELLIVSGIYLVAAVVLFVRRHRAVRDLVVDGLRTPYADLTESK
jgi:cation:H+ antiporter